MAQHTIVGAGPVGSALAQHLLAQGDEVRVVTRSGGGIDGVERIRANAADADALTSAATGSVALYNCVNPPYHQWAEQWPPIADALIRAAERTGAVLGTTGNLYGYGEVDSPMTEQTPPAATGTKGKVRNKMWADALAAQQAGRIRTFEVRGSDYLGGNSILATVIIPSWRKGRTAMVPGPLDVPHTFTDTRDVAALLAVGATDERAWGKVWHVPSQDPITVGELARRAAGRLGVEGRVRPLPYVAVWLAGLTNPFIKELRETQHQFRRPFVLDSSAAQQMFGLKAHDLDDSIAYDLENGAPAPGTKAA